MNDQRQPENPVAQERDADLSTLDDEELVRESEREALRRARDERKAAKDAAEAKEAERSLDRRERIVLVALLAFAALVSAAVVFTGLEEKDADLVRAGLLALGTACGAATMRLMALLRSRT